MDGEENFGQRMTRLKREGGLNMGGRHKIADKYKRQIAVTEKVFATAAPAIAQEYIDELSPADPERCPLHGGVLACTDRSCFYESQRTTFNHKAAAYALDRIMGKPTTRSENVITVRLVQQLTAEFAVIFMKVNELDDPLTRRTAFADECERLALVWSGNAGAA